MSLERSFNKPVELGHEYELEIKELSRRGDRVARVESFVVFIPQTKPSDNVKGQDQLCWSQIRNGQSRPIIPWEGFLPVSSFFQRPLSRDTNES